MFRIAMRSFAAIAAATSPSFLRCRSIPCIFLTGMALDFTTATQKRVQLNAAADAAALAAVTPP